MNDEPFHVPAPDAVVFEERWDKGQSFRSGCVWRVGKGDVFYFRPGHETYPVFRQPEPLRVIENAVRWLGSYEVANPHETDLGKTSGFQKIQVRRHLPGDGKKRLARHEIQPDKNQTGSQCRFFSFFFHSAPVDPILPALGPIHGCRTAWQGGRGFLGPVHAQP